MKNFLDLTVDPARVEAVSLNGFLPHHGFSYSINPVKIGLVYLCGRAEPVRCSEEAATKLMAHLEPQAGTGEGGK